MPYARIIPAPSFYFHVFETPDTDARTSTYLVIHGHSPVNREKIISLLGLDDPRYWDRRSFDFKGTWADNFGQDRAAMKDDWSGLGGVEKEDAIMSLSMGPIFDRTQEHLVAADQAVVRLRRRLLDCVKLVENGEEPLGAAARGSHQCELHLRRAARPALADGRTSLRNPAGASGGMTL